MTMNKNTFFRRNYKEILISLYFPVYLLWFFMLEQISPENMFIVKNPLDAFIPFCEYFIVPYLLWFPYLFGGIIWFFFMDRKGGFFKLGVTLILGLTTCLLIYTFFPNAQDLRPETYPNENVFTYIVGLLQGFDTPTNVCPSIHVFSTVALHIAIVKSPRAKKYGWVKYASFVLAVLICMSTVFLKQHSFTDVLCALVLNAVLYGIIYWRRQAGSN